MQGTEIRKRPGLVEGMLEAETRSVNAGVPLPVRGSGNARSRRVRAVDPVPAYGITDLHGNPFRRKDEIADVDLNGGGFQDFGKQDNYAANP